MDSQLLLIEYPFLFHSMSMLHPAGGQGSYMQKSIHFLFFIKVAVDQ